MLQRIPKNPFSLIALFLIALVYLLVHLTGYNQGLSPLSYIIYFLIFLSGTWFTRATLLFYFSDLTVALTLVALGFGTNLFYMVSFDYQLQPVLLFSLYAAVVFLTASWHQQQKLFQAILLAVALGMVILIQPTGVLSLLIPVLWGVHDKESRKSKIKLVKINLRQLLIFSGCLMIFVILPVLVWKISPGEIPFLSFRLPGVFYSFSSWIWNDLFSFDHGLFIYTPIFIFAVTGFYYFADRNRPLFQAVFLLCILDLFLETSWSKLGIAPVFGQIAFIPVYGLLAFPMASLLGFIKEGQRWPRMVLLFSLAFFLFLNLFQTWQFNRGLLSSSGMNADAYGQIFLRTSLPLMKDQPGAKMVSDSTLILKDETRVSKTTMSSFDFEDPKDVNKQNLEKVHVKSGARALIMDPTTRFSPGLYMRYNEFLKQPRIGLRITASVYTEDAASFSDVSLVISSIHESSNYQYKRLNLGTLRFKSGGWNTVSLDYLIPSDPLPDDQLVSYVWYTGNSRIFVDDIKCEAFELKK